MLQKPYRYFLSNEGWANSGCCHFEQKNRNFHDTRQIHSNTNAWCSDDFTSVFLQSLSVVIMPARAPSRDSAASVPSVRTTSAAEVARSIDEDIRTLYHFEDGKAFPNVCFACDSFIGQKVTHVDLAMVHANRAKLKPYAVDNLPSAISGHYSYTGAHFQDRMQGCLLSPRARIGAYLQGRKYRFVSCTSCKAQSVAATIQKMALQMVTFLVLRLGYLKSLRLPSWPSLHQCVPLVTALFIRVASIRR